MIGQFGVITHDEAGPTEARVVGQFGVITHDAAGDVRIVGQFGVVTHDLEPDNLKINGMMIEAATSGAPAPETRGCGAYGQFIFPDPSLCHVESITSEGGLCTGTLLADDGNCGTMIPSLSGLPADEALDEAVIEIVKAGSESQATWTYKQGAAGAEIGQSDPSHISTWHEVWDGISIDPDAWQAGSAACYCSASKEVLVVAYDNSSDEFLLARRDASTFGVSYSRVRLSLSPAVDEAGGASAVPRYRTSIVEVKPGLLLLAYMYRSVFDGAFDYYKIAVHKSVDNGLTWSLVTDDVTGGAVAADLALGIRMAVSGSWVRIAFRAVSAGAWWYASSRDGISWDAVASALTPETSWGNAEEPAPYDLCGVGDGLFLLVHGNNPGGSWTYAHATNDNDWTNIGVGTGAGLANRDTPGAGVVVSIAAVRAWNRVWVLLTTTDGAASNVDDQFNLYHQEVDRLLVHGPGSPGTPVATEWKPIEPLGGFQGMRFWPSWPTLVDEGGRQLALYAGAYDENDVQWDAGDTIAAFIAPLSTRPLGEQSVGDHRGATPAGAGTTLVQLFDVYWGCGTQRPAGAADASPDTGWTQNSAAAFSVTYSKGTLTLGTVAGRVTYSLTRASSGTDSWMRSGGVLGFQAKHNSGSSTASLQSGIRITGEMPQPINGEIDLEIRFDGTTILVYDNYAAATLTSIAFDCTRRFECRLSFRWQYLSILTCRLSAFHVDDEDSLVQSAIVNPTAGINAGVIDSIEWGEHAGSTANADWHEVWIVKNPAASINEEDNNYLGIWLGDRTVLAPNCMLVSWGGHTAALGDTFTEVRCHAYSADRALQDSRLLDWRSGGASPLATQELILVRDPDDPEARFVHDCIALFGLEERNVAVDYDNDPAFGSPIAAGTLNTDRFIGLEVVSTEGGTITIDLDTYEANVGRPPRNGELAGMRIEVMTGALAGAVYCIDTHCGDVVTVSMDGDAPDLSTMAATDTIDVFATFGTLEYAVGRVVQRYMRLTFSATATCSGDHRLAALVAGCCVEVPFQLEWTHSDTEESNVEIFDGEGGIEWAHQRGPSRRTWTGRLLNDYQGWRQSLRSLLRVLAAFEARPIVFTPDDENDQSAIYGRWVGDNELANSFWYDTTHAVEGTTQIPGGDLAIRIREIP